DGEAVRKQRIPALARSAGAITTSVQQPRETLTPEREGSEPVPLCCQPAPLRCGALMSAERWPPARPWERSPPRRWPTPEPPVLTTPRRSVEFSHGGLFRKVRAARRVIAGAGTIPDAPRTASAATVRLPT